MKDEGSRMKNENQPQMTTDERGLKVRLLGIVRRIKRAHEIHSEKFRNSGDNADCYDYGAAIAYGDVLVEIFDALTGHAHAHEVPATPCGSQSRAPDSELVRCLRDAAPWIRATCEQLRTCLSSDDGNNRHLREGSRKLRAVLDCLEDQSSVPGGSQSRVPDSRPEGQRAPCPEVVDDGDAPDRPPSGAGDPENAYIHLVTHRDSCRQRLPDGWRLRRHDFNGVRDHSVMTKPYQSFTREDHSLFEAFKDLKPDVDRGHPGGLKCLIRVTAFDRPSVEDADGDGFVDAWDWINQKWFLTHWTRFRALPTQMEDGNAAFKRRYPVWVPRGLGSRAPSRSADDQPDAKS